MANASGPVGPTAATVTAMTADLERRGPDDVGLWQDESSRTALGFRRLSIIDLTPAGAQPMRSADDGDVLVFNGEIYNHRELRSDLARAGIAFNVLRINSMDFSSRPPAA